MSTIRGFRNTKRGAPVPAFAGLVSREGLDSEGTVLAIAQALTQLGIHKKLNDIVAKAQSIETGIMQSRSRLKPEHLC